MAKFLYNAIDKTGKTVKGELEAADKKALKRLLKPGGLSLINAREIGAVKEKGKKEKKKNMFTRVSLKELALVTRQLSTMIESGISLLKAITIISNQVENPILKEVFESVKNDLSGGEALSKALSKFPKYFDTLYVSMVKAGEASGALDIVLNRLASAMEDAQELRGKVRGAMIYPIVVIVIAVSIVTFLLVAIVPTFTKMFTEAGMELPGLTQMVVDTSDFLKSYWWTIIIALGITGYMFKKWLATEKGRYKFDKTFLKMPVFGTLMRKVGVARFTRIMGTLLDSGVPILVTFQIASNTIGNKVLAEVVDMAHASIKEGNTIAKPLAESGEFPLMVTQMIEVGEESGTMVEMLNKMSDFLEREVKETIAATVALLEPFALVVMATIVGTIVIAMFLPMLNMADAVG